MDVKIDWHQVALNLRRVKPLVHIARDAGMDAGTLRRIARGGTEEPKHMAATLLLDMHLDHCPERHNRASITLRGN